MNRQIALLTLVTVTLVACANAPQKIVKPAPVVDLANGPSGKAAKEETNLVVPSTNTTAQTSGAYLAGDGPGADAPAHLEDTPDAVPKPEPLHRYANRPYTALGKTYTPLEITGNYKETGIASWYGKKFHGQRTSIGEVYDMYGMSAAHPILPIPSYARVTNLANQKSVIVRVNDRGPFLHDRIIDLSYTAAYKLGIINNGSAQVQVESIAVDGTEPVTVATVVSSPITSAPLPVESASAVVAVAEVPASAPIAATPVATAPVEAAAGSVYLQLGAFKSPQAAETFLTKMRAKLGSAGKSLSLFQKGGLERVHLGPYATQEEARSAAGKLKSQLGVKSYVSLH
jgi:rare lipoprotein A